MSSRISFDLRSDLTPVIYGQTLDRIQSIFGVQLSIRTSESDENCDHVTICGDVPHINGAKEYIMSMHDQPDDMKTTPVPAAYQIHLLGVNGDRRMQVEKATSTQISVEKGVATVRGTSSACSYAVLRIRDYIRFFRELEKREMELGDYDNLPYAPVKAMLKQFEDSACAPQTQKETLESSEAELIEYAVKTGWTECQAREAMKKMGSVVSANRLLTTLMNMYPQKSKGRKTPDVTARTTSHQSSNETRTVGETSESSSDTESINERSGGPRTIVIDGSNVAMSYSNGKYFACVALKKVVKYFQDLGHDKITVFVPQWRNETTRPESPIEDQYILNELKASQNLVFTPSRRINGKRLTSYDDQYIVNLAAKRKGVIVSNDLFRDLVNMRADFRETIEKRLLLYCWADGIFMPAGDPLGRHGPGIRDFLRFPTDEADANTGRQSAVDADHTLVCKYGRTCTRGALCKFRHPNRNENSKMAAAGGKTKSNNAHPPSRFTTTSIDSPNYLGLTARDMPASDAPTEVCHIPDGLVSFVQKPDGSDPRKKVMPQPPPPPQAAAAAAAAPYAHPGQGYEYEAGYAEYDPYYGQVAYGAQAQAQAQAQAYYYGPHHQMPYGQPQCYGHHGQQAYSGHPYAAMDYDARYAPPPPHAVPDYQQQAAAASGHPLPPPPPPSMRYGAIAEAGDMASQSRFQTVPELYPPQFEQDQQSHYDCEAYGRNGASAEDAYGGGYTAAAAAAAHPDAGLGSYNAAAAAATHPDAGLSDADTERTVQEFLQSSYLHKELTSAGKIHCREELARATLSEKRGIIHGVQDLVCYMKFALTSPSQNSS